MLAFLVTPIGKFLGKIGLYLMAALIIAGLAFGLYEVWKKQIEAAELQKFNQQQLEQITQDNAKYAAQLKTINDLQNQILSDNQKTQDALNAKIQPLNDYLNSAAVQSEDKGSSDILKETIKRLGN